MFRWSRPIVGLENAQNRSIGAARWRVTAEDDHADWKQTGTH